MKKEEKYHVPIRNMEHDPYEYQELRGMAQGILWALDRSPKQAEFALHAAGQMIAVANETESDTVELPYLQGWISGLRKVLSCPEAFINDAGRILMEGGNDDRIYDC